MSEDQPIGVEIGADGATVEPTAPSNEDALLAALAEIKRLQAALDAAPAAQEEAPDAAPPAPSEPEVDESLILPHESWQDVADRLGVNVDTLFAWNTGLGGCFSMGMVPVGQRVQHLDEIRAASVEIPAESAAE